MYKETCDFNISEYGRQHGQSSCPLLVVKTKLKSAFLMWHHHGDNNTAFQLKQVNFLVTLEKSLTIHEWERYRYPHLFSMNWEKIFPYIGKFMETSFPYPELCGFLNSIDFDSKPMVWEYISFPHNIPIVWNFTLPILCGLFGFHNNF